MNNEFGEDLVLSSSREKKRVNERGGRSIPKLNAFTTKAEPGRIGNQDGSKKSFGPSRKCPACSGQHGLWKCEKNWHKARGFVSSVLMEDISRTVVPKKPSSVRSKAVLKTIIPCYTPTLMSKWKEDVPQTLASMVPLGAREQLGPVRSVFAWEFFLLK